MARQAERGGGDVQVNDTNRNKRSIGRLALLCFVLQLALAPNIGFGDGRANFALIFAAVVALGIGGRTGVLSGFLAGLVFDLSTTGPIGLMALLLTVSSFLMGREGRNRLSEDSAASFVTFGVHDLLVCLAYHLTMLLVGQAQSLSDVVFARTLPTFVLTLVFFIPFALYYVRPGGGGTPGLGRHSRTGRAARGGRYSLGKL